MKEEKQMKQEELEQITGGWPKFEPDPHPGERWMRCRICQKEIRLEEKERHQQETGHIFFEKIGEW